MRGFEKRKGFTLSDYHPLVSPLSSVWSLLPGAVVC